MGNLEWLDHLGRRDMYLQASMWRCEEIGVIRIS